MRYNKDTTARRQLGIRLAATGHFMPQEQSKPQPQPPRQPEAAPAAPRRHSVRSCPP